MEQRLDELEGNLNYYASQMIRESPESKTDYFIHLLEVSFVDISSFQS